MERTQLSEEQIEGALARLPRWRYSPRDGLDRILRRYEFKNYDQGLAFVNRVSVHADQLDHHPMIKLSWGSVCVIWWTHDRQGVTDLDFECARRCDQEYESE